MLYLLPERQFGVVILSNLEGQQSSLDFIELSRKISTLLLPNESDLRHARGRTIYETGSSHYADPIRMRS